MEIISEIWSKYLVHLLDIVIVAYIFYRIILIIKGTRAVQIVLGLVALIIITILARDFVHLSTLSWLLEKFWFSAIIILSVVFHNEIRYGLAKLGSRMLPYNMSAKTNFLEEIAAAAAAMSETRIGAIIVFEKEIGLKNYTDTGIKINGETSSELILSVFQTKSPIHDGAIIIKDEKLHSAGCVLPISYDIDMKHFGTRHRAAVGLSSMTDAIVLVVSEETGRISIAKSGRIEVVSKTDLLEKISKLYFQRGE